ncbi:hypothetical protein NIM87_13150 [Devosia sp. XJ19-1]|uniref:Uncharacterized protein n=1 Tax=Devosia ureilytica TaxID=2952754 RepID=A0A9Q4FTK5_9HYPH|nr:hypothetical protein [Devosia ureilytica]MCP8884460.1 hypothetical protein [Devosia ureilytica]MCP8888068.1 hypothetical protein [Devosia ureilytica]
MSQGTRHGLVRLVAGFAIWSIAFIVLYAAQALGCAYGWGAWHRPVLIVIYLFALAPLIWLSTRPRPDGTDAILPTAARWANRAALLASVLVFLPVTFASLCA